MFEGLIQLFIDIMGSLASAFYQIVNGVLPEEAIYDLTYNGFNIYLFSDTGWFTEPIPIVYIIIYVMFFLLFFFLLRLLYKATKKFINMIFGVFRV